MSRRTQDTELLARLGVRLRQVRLAAGLTQARLAEASNLQPNSVSLMENGALAPTLTTLSLLARALGVRLMDLVAFDGGAVSPSPGDAEEASLLNDYRTLDPEAQQLVRALVRTLRRTKR